MQKLQNFALQPIEISQRYNAVPAVCTYPSIF